MAAAEEPATNTNKKHVAVDITMHFKVILDLIRWSIPLFDTGTTFKRAKRFYVNIKKQEINNNAIFLSLGISIKLNCLFLKNHMSPNGDVSTALGTGSIKIYYLINHNH